MSEHALKPRRTVLSNQVFRLPGGTEDNDLWTMIDTSESGDPCIRSTWVPTDEQRERISNGENIELVIWGTVQPPVTIMLCDYELGKPHEHN